MKYKNHFYPNFKDSFRLLIRMMILSLIISIAAGILLVILTQGFGVESSLLTSAHLLVAYSIPIIVVIQLAYRRIRERNKVKYQLGFHLLPFVPFALIFLTGMALMVLIEPLEAMMPKLDYFIKQYSQMMRPDVLSFLSVVIAAPLLEEIFFRGILLEGFLHNYSPWKAILLSALIFGGIHINPMQVPGAFIIGLFLGWVYWKTRTLLPVILIHFINNLISFLLYIRHGDALFQPDPILGRSLGYWVLIGTAGIITILGILWLKKHWRNQPTPIRIKSKSVSPDKSKF
jgi:membrane protease YdiL (CAAX protease family)